MPTCKDCIHYELCRYNTYEKAKITGEDEKKLITIKNNIPCKFFMGSPCVVLPFKVGDTIYVPWKDRNSLSTKKHTDIMPLKIRAIGSTEDKPEWFINTSVMSFKVSEYRNRFFTLLREAENVLKEGVDNGNL